MCRLKSSCDTRIWGMPVTLSSTRAGTLHSHILSTGHCACYTVTAHFMPVGCIWKELVPVLKVAPHFCHFWETRSMSEGQGQKSQCLLASFTILVLKNVHHILKNKYSSMKWLKSIKLSQSASEMFNKLFEVPQECSWQPHSWSWALPLSRLAVKTWVSLLTRIIAALSWTAQVSISGIL